MRKFIVGSRASELALVQTHGVINRLKHIDSHLRIHVKEIITTGDEIVHKTLSKIGGKGLFVKEIEDALLQKKIDFAVHSMKDLPGEIPEGLVITALGNRSDPRDCLLSTSGLPLLELPSGAKIGTSSLRRQSQILAIRSDVVVEPLRGNIHTRIRKLQEGHFDAIILAVAGLQRMNWTDKITHVFQMEEMMPAVGQGALAVQCRKEDIECIQLLQPFHDEETAKAIYAERAFLMSLEGDCHLPIAAYAQVKGAEVHLSALVASADGKSIITGKGKGREAWNVGRELAQDFIRRGAEQLLGQ